MLISRGEGGVRHVREAVFWKGFGLIEVGFMMTDEVFCCCVWVRAGGEFGGPLWLSPQREGYYRGKEKRLWSEEDSITIQFLLSAVVAVGYACG